jgi:hypothetical protein
MKILKPQPLQIKIKTQKIKIQLMSINQEFPLIQMIFKMRI